VRTTVEDRPVPEETHKPVADEQTLAKLLEAAYVLQEHNREMKRLELRPGSKGQRVEAQSDSPRIQNSSANVKSPERALSTDLTSTLEKIAETQRQIQIRRMELESALKLVAERLSEMTNAAGAAIGIVEGRSVRYRAVAGSGVPALETSIPLEKAVCAPCLKTGQVLRSSDVGAEHLLDDAEDNRRGIGSLIAVPVYHDGGIAGGLELYYRSENAFNESDVHTCQLMAGLVAEALVREQEVAWRKSVATERAAMLEALEKLHPNLAALVEPAERIASADEQGGLAAASFSCRKCGHELVADEQFCGQCGAARAADYEAPNMQSKVASLWQMQALQKKPLSESEPNSDQKATDQAVVSRESLIARALAQQIPELFASEDLETEADSKIVEMPTPRELQDAAQIEGEHAGTDTAETDEARVESTNQKQALTKSVTPHAANWRSPASAQAFFEQIISSQRAQIALQFWNRHRGDIYLVIAVILVLCVIRWGLFAGPRVKATSTPATATSAHRKPARDPGLSFFDRVLVQLGLAEAPDPTPDKGNPAVQVWVDLHTALYYCPGADLYGKTQKGRFTTQREAQLDQFEPAYRKTCD
jgi:GAF domain-containing protein